MTNNSQTLQNLAKSAQSIEKEREQIIAELRAEIKEAKESQKKQLCFIIGAGIGSAIVIIGVNFAINFTLIKLLVETF